MVSAACVLTIDTIPQMQALASTWSGHRTCIVDHSRIDTVTIAKTTISVK